MEYCYKTNILPQQNTEGQQTGCPCCWWERQLFIFGIANFNFHILSSYAIDYQKQISFLALTYRIDILYLIGGTWTDTSLYKGRLIPDLYQDLHNVAIVKSTLKIPHRHNGAIPTRIKGHDLKDQVAYFISSQHTKNGNPNIHVIDGIYNIKGNQTLYIMVVNYTNKHVPFNKGQCIGHMEPPMDRDVPNICQQCYHTENDDNQVQLDTSYPFTSPLSGSEMIPRWIIQIIEIPIFQRWDKYWHDLSDQNAN